MGQIITEVIKIDRSQPFDPTDFLGNGWTIAEEDRRSLALTEVDLAKVRLETMFREGETVLKGEERLRRLKEAGHIRLDANVFSALWKNQALIPERWKERVNGETLYIHFEGIELRHPCGDRCVLCLYWSDGQWRRGFSWLEVDWLVRSPSAVLASI